MIKRITFLSRPPDVPTSDLDRWLVERSGELATAPVPARPRRLAVCIALEGFESEPAPHDALELAWFDDADHHDRLRAWRGSRDAVRNEPVVVADEAVMRGADWLEQRWARGGECVKHMALATRAAQLTPEEFSARWRSRAGSVGGGASAVAIPDLARGRAYVQNHPLPSVDGWRYDAVNEVYFDAVDALRERIAWFAEHLGGGAEDDLVGASWFLAVREVPIIVP